jgi:hypothetical protein
MLHFGRVNDFEILLALYRRHHFQVGPNHERHEELGDWFGEDFDPQGFSIDRIYQMLLPVRRRGKTESCALAAVYYIASPRMTHTFAES